MEQLRILFLQQVVMELERGRIMPAEQLQLRQVLLGGQDFIMIMMGMEILEITLVTTVKVLA
jgi:hypothetical protein